MSTLSALHGAFHTMFSNLFISLPVPVDPNGSLTKQTIIVTGSNQGLGLEASRHLVRLGVEKLIMGVRNLEKGEVAKKDILASTKRDASCIEVWHIDMDNYESVKSFAARANNLPRLDAVLANAGIFTMAFSKAEDNEKTITTNVVSTFLLGMLLLPKLRQTAEQSGIVPRFVIPNSALHYLSPIKELDVKEGSIFTTLNDPKTAAMASRYMLTKLAVIYIVRELAERMKESKKPAVVFNTPNPSWCQSSLTREVNAPGQKIIEKIFQRTTEVGSRALVDGILAGVESQGQYMTNCHVQAPAGFVTNAKGIQIQRNLFNELSAKLDKIAPGIMEGL